MTLAQKVRAILSTIGNCELAAVMIQDAAAAEAVRLTAQMQEDAEAPHLAKQRERQARYRDRVRTGGELRRADDVEVAQEIEAAELASPNQQTLPAINDVTCDVTNDVTNDVTVTSQTTSLIPPPYVSPPNGRKDLPLPPNVVAKTAKRKRREPTAADHDPEFDAWYAAYPRKVERGDALKAWRQTADRRPPLARMLATLSWQRQSPDWTKDEGKWIKHPGSYLRAEKWADEPRGMVAATSPEDPIAAMNARMAAKYEQRGPT